MPKIQNLRFANQTVGISVEDVTFDENGVGEIKDEALFKEVCTFPGFFDYEAIAAQEKAREDEAKAQEEALAKAEADAKEAEAKAKAEADKAAKTAKK